MSKFTKSNYSWVLLALLAAAFFAGMNALGGFRFVDPDGYYHARAADLLVHGQLHRTFPWLQYTIWNVVYSDQHFLYHLLLWPFRSLPVLQWSVVAFGTLAVLAFAYVLRVYKINYWLWVLLLLLGSTDFLFRITLVKANALSLVLLFLTLVVLEKKRYWLLVPVSWVFVWTYGGFVFLPLVVGLFSLVSLFNGSGFLWRPVMLTLVGLMLGLLTHPQYPNILINLYYQIFQAGLGAGTYIAAGVEWFPYQASVLLKTNYAVLAIWVLCAANFLVNHRKPHSPAAQSLFLVSICFFVLMLKSQRFVEYWVPFALLFSAQACQVYLRQFQWAAFRQAFNNFWQFRLALLVGLALACAAAGTTLSQVRAYYASAKPPDLYRNAAAWLSNHSAPGDIVFNAQWDQFPQLFYWNPKNYYIVGLDPTFMYDYSPGLYAEWAMVSADQAWGGQEAELYRIVHDDFRASYLFVEASRNPNLKNYLDRSAPSRFTKVYEDGATALYRVD
jgi:hypothetical protein